MENFELQASSRAVTGKKTGAFRKDKKIPGVLYGHNVKNVTLLVGYPEFDSIYRKAGTSSLINLKVADQNPVKVLIQEIQKDPVSERYLHVDFRQVKMTEKISAEVELKFIGESKAVKEEGGILLKNITAVRIEALPQDLVHEIVVDITPLQKFDDHVRIRDLKLPAGITVLEKDDTVVASAQAPRSEEELKSLEEKPEEKVEDVESVEKKKVAEEEAPEGEEVQPAEKKPGEKKPSPK